VNSSRSGRRKKPYGSINSFLSRLAYPCGAITSLQCDVFPRPHRLTIPHPCLESSGTAGHARACGAAPNMRCGVPQAPMRRGNTIASSSFPHPRRIGGNRNLRWYSHVALWPTIPKYLSNSSCRHEFCAYVAGAVRSCTTRCRPSLTLRPSAWRKHVLAVRCLTAAPSASETPSLSKKIGIAGRAQTCEAAQ